MDKNFLTAAGINYDEGVQRFSGAVELYEKYLNKFFDDDLFQKLEACMASKNYEEASRLAHSLKGTSGNLSVSNVYADAAELMNLFRSEGRLDEVRVSSVFSHLKESYILARNAVKT